MTFFKSIITHKKIVAIIATVALLTLPVAAIVTQLLLPSDGIWQHLIDTVMADYVYHSVVLMLGVGLGACIVGVSSAWLVAMFDFPGRRYFEWLLILPMAMPAYIVAYAYTWFLDFSGPLQSMLRSLTNWQYGDYWFPEIRSLSGAMMVMIVVLYPYVYLMCRATFVNQSRQFVEVSRTLGNGWWQTFFRVSLPLARPAIFAGVVLVLMETLADYGTVKYFGVSTFATGILRTWHGMDSVPGAAQLASILLVMVIVIMSLEYFWRGQAKHDQLTKSQQSVMRLRLTGKIRLLASLWCLLIVALGFIIPIVLLFNMLIDSKAYDLSTGFLPLLYRSLLLAAAAAIVTVLVASVFVYARRKYRSHSIKLLINWAGLGYAIPGTVIALGVTIALTWVDQSINKLFFWLFNMDVNVLLTGSVFALIFAYLFRFLAVAMQSVGVGLSTVSQHMDEVAYLVGKKDGYIFTKIHLPIIRNSVLTALLLVFVDVLKELPITFVLRPFNFDTLAVKTFELASDERLAESALPALFIVMAGIIPVILLSKTINRRKHAISA